MVTRQDIIHGLQALELNSSSSVIVHSSLRSFGYVEGGAVSVCEALVSTCGTILMPAGSWDCTGVLAPPGLVRPHNEVRNAVTWQEFDEALAHATPFSKDLPIDKELGIIPETMRRQIPHFRSSHPLLSYVAIGRDAQDLLAAQRLDWPLGPIEALAERGGDVLLLGVSHTSNTAIHVAEQRLGRSRFYRYAKVAKNIWMELPNVPGQSHKFDDIEPLCASVTREVVVGNCRMRRIAIADILAIAKQMILANPSALLCDKVDCRCYAALQQRLEIVHSLRVPSSISGDSTYGDDAVY